MDAKYEIRQLSPFDLEAGFLETLAALRDTDLTPQEALAVYWDRSSRGNILTYVVVDAGRVIATATLVVERKFIHAGGLVGHIEDVAVHKDFQGQGVGSLLMERLVAEGTALGCYKLILDCAPELVPFYTRFGFAEYEQNMRLNCGSKG